MRDPSGSVDLLVAGGLAVGHGAAPVCAPVDLRLSAGRAPAIAGPNGSGESTLLRTLVGLLEPLAGTVTLAGAPVDERSATLRRDVAAVLDDDSFFVSLTGREHLLLTARGHGVARTEGLGALPPLVWAGCLAGWGLAAARRGRRPRCAARRAPIRTGPGRSSPPRWACCRPGSAPRSCRGWPSASSAACRCSPRS